MQRRRVETHIAHDAVAEAITDCIAPKLTPIPVDDWVLRGHGAIAAALRTHGEAIDESSPEALANLLDAIERAVFDRFGIGAWIPAASQSPERGAVVLAWHRTQGHMVLEYAPDDTGRCWFTQECESVESADVTAWRLLPPGLG